LVATLDRAIEFCQSTLAYGAARDRSPLRREFDLRALVEEIVETEAAAGASAICYAIEIPPKFELYADRDHVRRALENLTRNAAQALKQSGRQACGSAAVRFAAIRTADDLALIEVSDSGPGLPPGAEDHIFEPFHDSTRLGGSGLGLAIAGDLVERNGGSIRLAPAEPEDFYCGARFLITLPAPKGARRAALTHSDA
jgi:signal transduction histidine kinase